jgi:uncharacterized membrane protein
MHKEEREHPMTFGEALKERFAELLGFVLFLGWVAFLVLHKILHAI